MAFQCPLCGAPEYQRVVVPRPPREPYETEFFACLGCSTVFLEPALFMAAPEFRAEHERIAAEEAAREQGARKPCRHAVAEAAGAAIPLLAREGEARARMGTDV